MAILRGGKRIGGFDIRIGLPRDRSLDNVNNDPRFRQRAGGNPETTMGRFQAMVNEGEGFARKARYYVEFYLPKSIPITGVSAGDENNDVSGASMEQRMAFKQQGEMNAVQMANARRVQAFCNAIAMPEKEIQTKEIKHNGPPRRFAYDYKATSIDATFYADKFMRERSYFEMWQNAAYSNTTHNFNFYDNYVSDMNIFQLGSFESRNERDDITYGVKLFDCFPKIVSKVDYAHTANEIQTFSVTFEYRNWVNYFIDKAGQVELGSPNFRDVTVKSGGGPFGGLLGKLPPELRRAGTEVLQGIKRRLPIGGITGGRVFPPFPNFPPLNI